MKATIADAVFFKDSVKIISELITEANFTFSKDMVEMRAMTPDVTTFVTFKIMGSRFTEYQIANDIAVAIDFNKLKNILSRATESDVLVMECKDKKPTKLSITLLGERKRKFNLSLIEEQHEQSRPDLKFDVETTLDSEAIFETIEDAGLIAESMQIYLNKSLKMIAQTETDDVEIDYPDTIELKYHNDEIVKPFKSKYSVEILKKIAKSKKICNKVTLQLSKDYPMLMQYAEPEKFDLSFVIAPRVDPL